jgi:uridine kinase
MSLAQFIPESNELVMGAMLRLITEYLRRGNSTPMVLAINGDTAVGKTRLAKDLQRRLENTDVSATLVSTDAWLRQSREERLDAGQTGLDAGRYALDELCSTLERLLAGEPVELPTYDHSLGRHGEPEKVHAGRVVIVEGLMSTHQRVKSDAVIWLEHAGELHAERRVSRDIEFRGYEPEAAVANWNRHLRDWPSFLATCRPLEIDLLITVNRMGMWLLEVPTFHHPSDNNF